MNLKKLVVDEFSGENAQKLYSKMAFEGFWDSEKIMINKYFKKPKTTKLLDLGCGTGRTTIPLKKMGFDLVGVDLTPEMIKSAKKIDKSLNQKIDYRVGDATNLDFKDDSFDYVLFSNNGWSQIPGKDNRAKALLEIKRVLKKGGVFLFTTHQRKMKGFTWFWIKSWFRVRVLKLFGFEIWEQDFGDRFFDRERQSGKRVYVTKQFIHIPSVNEVKKSLSKAGFEVLAVKTDLDPHRNRPTLVPPAFYAVKKP